MKYKVRAISPSDLEQLLQLFQEFAHFEKHPDQMQNSLAKMQRDAQYLHGFVIEDDAQKLIGYATYFYTFHTWSGKGMYMDDLYVQKQHRGQGLGKSLLNKVIELAEETGCEKLQWLVSNWNTDAMDFYKSIGAEITNNEHQCELKFNQIKTA
jgi:GNAT superfamily N-acetyltransferase